MPTPSQPATLPTHAELMVGARRAALGCTCPPGDGRPRRTCAAWPAHQAASRARRGLPA